MLHLGNLMPRESGRVHNRLLKLGRRGAASHHVEPIAVAAILGYWSVSLILVIGVALHAFGWLYLAQQAKPGRDTSG